MTTATYQGTTKEDLERRILNIEKDLLNNQMEVWEAKEFKQVIDIYQKEIDCINEAQEILNNL